MSEPTNPSGPGLDHQYQVTHYIQPPGNYGAWQQITSALHTAEDAYRWIAQHVAGDYSADLQGPVSVSETPPEAVQADTSADSPQAADVAPSDADTPAGVTE